ncbi:TetR/AcrR family transcriptional regulator [Streptomyces alboniger]|uniref:TetR/AcrR family transcriptional regulator n=1 Tax=Streptomyces alboniger TaxID=132473 RepID=A0A5J6HN99_STRAD|nr:TetR/AcrR family transcriptional regulator [Streptomyces alboniger]QEV21779.1 TetR/AcrR family transcriptional regulator [Streptomyces alboniger]
MSTPKAPRSGYHHGDLRNALVGAGVALATKGGPQEVVLRAVAREVGVSPTAAYRHFANREDLLHAVRLAALARLAGAMEQEVIAGKRRRDPVEDAVRRLRALGAGYLRFALAEPGLFRMACCDTSAQTADFSLVSDSRAFALLTEVIDTLAGHGLIESGSRPYSEMAAWAPIHGMATLLLDGLLDALPPRQRQAAVDRVIEVTVEGLCGQGVVADAGRSWTRRLWSPVRKREGGPGERP